MAKKIISPSGISLFLFIFGACICFAGEVRWQDVGRELLGVKSVLINPDNPNIIYTGADAGVFKTENAGASWRNILSIGGQHRGVNFLLFDPKGKNILYAATSQGLFYSANAGKDWKRVFKGRNSFENECTGLAILDYGIYLGTKGGLFVSKDRGYFWRKEKGKLGSSHILAIAYDRIEPKYIYAASTEGVFRTGNAGKDWERIFVVSAGEDGQDNDMQEEIDDKDEKGESSGVRYLTLGLQDNGNVYLASTKGIYRSRDRGKQWERLSSYGLLSNQLKFLLVPAKGNLYLAAKSEVFVYTQERWQEMSYGFFRGAVNALALDKAGNLYAACANGLFKAVINSSGIDNLKPAQAIPQDEPQIRDLQQVAIKYAEVEPEKILRWRKAAAKRAFLPKLSASISRDTTDLWHWEGGSTTKENDDNLRRGRDNLDWGITLSWDLSDLLWDASQTSIDVRSRLMVELRNDILDQVNKLYFERLRVRMELDSLNVEDRKKRFEKELKLQELASSLDGLTAGYYSEQLQYINKHR